MSDDSTIARRDLFAGALGLAALAGFARSAAAADYPASDVEKNNIKLIEDFSKAFDEPKPDVNKILSFMHDDIIWSTGPTRPANKSKAVVGEFLKTVIFKNPARYNLKIGDSFARGPMVVHVRVDTRSVEGGPYAPAPGPIGSVFYIKDGKIAEFYELGFPKA